MSNKHEAMLNYLQQCPHIADLFFQFGESEAGDTILSTNASEYVAEEFLDRSAVKWYDFALIRYEELTTLPNVADNADIMHAVEQIIGWIEAQDEAGNYPDFGGNCRTQSVLPLQNSPTVAGQDEKSAKYLIQCRVEYLEERSQN